MSGPDEVRCMLLRGGTSKGAYFLAGDLPGDTAGRDGLLLRVMGSPDPRQIDGLGGAHPLTSKVAVVSVSADPAADVDYLFLQVAVDKAEVSDRQNCGNILAGVGPFAVERGLVEPGRAVPRYASSWSTPGTSRSRASHRGRARGLHGFRRDLRGARDGGSGGDRVPAGEQPAAAHRPCPGHRRRHPGDLCGQRHADRADRRVLAGRHRLRESEGPGGGSSPGRPAPRDPPGGGQADGSRGRRERHRAQADPARSAPHRRSRHDPHVHPGALPHLHRCPRRRERRRRAARGGRRRARRGAPARTGRPAAYRTPHRIPRHRSRCRVRPRGRRTRGPAHRRRPHRTQDLRRHGLPRPAGAAHHP